MSLQQKHLHHIIAITITQPEQVHGYSTAALEAMYMQLSWAISNIKMQLKGKKDDNLKRYERAQDRIGQELLNREFSTKPMPQPEQIASLFSF